ncbi:acetyl-CoA carboxylase biotin carboxyl carrier protein [Clostridium vincentii]|uniref:Biotin carboxyl carrier protein of acetyl-CoA carboxylase n=1 Tax=Clostridium vincentii TaxID=52704 RepID=A0A2T0BBC8_9CLOT|nr:acetyl-CoA carboxylase biotin carboxyl carrier protein [Clostridium vincentii]PRR81142.1 Biotin carboxyl carrier protein of acetyl-CoA carboxylase [Clostridium vincentii]
MDFKEVKELIETINASDIAFFEIVNENCHIKMDKSLNREIASTAISEEKPVVVNTTKTTISEPSANITSERKVEKVIEKEVEDDNLVVINSPMVGTYYGGLSPDSPSFVKDGDNINVGDTLCIIEAMKLMNEIESEVNGIIRKILVKDGDMVEYGQPLFKIKEA